MYRKRNLTPEELAAWFWSKLNGVTDPDACWTWSGSHNKAGYGHVSWLGRRICKAHRVAWELANGPIPEGMDILHRCDNPPCCNPSHLWPGTDADNAHDRERKGRGNHPSGDANGSRRHIERRPRGSTHAGAKLKESDIPKILAAYAAGETKKEIGERFGVAGENIHHIVRGNSWRHVPRGPA